MPDTVASSEANISSSGAQIASAEQAAPKKPDAVFTQGSTMGHVVRMTVTSSIGLMAIFVVDFLSLLYVSWLKQEVLTAAVGYASVVLFFMTSVNIGFMIAATALTARRLGMGDRQGAREIAGSSMGWMLVTSAVIVAIAIPLLKPILGLLGASGPVADIAHSYLLITLPSNLLMALGMGYSGILRAVGDANRSMYVTLAGGIVTAIVDPILIFGLGLGIYGAAICVVISRIVFALVGWHGAVKIHDIVARPSAALMRADGRAISAIAGPAILTNIATPFATAVVARIVSDYGPWAIAANAVIDRLIPIAFGALFALSGAVGPIMAQNWGAGMFHRMRAAMRDSFIFAAIYVLVSWAVLILCRHLIVDLFQLKGPAAEGVIFFCWISGPMWFFIGLLFTANAAFNNLGFPLYSTALNWGRATVGTIPFAWGGAQLYGYEGALGGMALGSVLFGVVGALLAIRVVGQLEQKQRHVPKPAATLVAQADSAA
jgi:putative MATE family efflux protein